MKNKVVEGTNILCLCNWSSFKSSLFIVANEFTQVTLSQLPPTTGKAKHINISVSRYGTVKTLKQLCLENIEVYNIPTETVERHTYFKEKDLLRTNVRELHLMTMNVFGNETKSCRNIGNKCVWRAL